MRIIYTTAALAETSERLFPESKNRSKRVRKKLLKRHGGEFRKEPTIWLIKGTVFAHPSLKREIEHQLQ